MNPIIDLSIGFHVDAGFKFLCGYEDPNGPTFVWSQMGYVVFLLNYPVIWVSRLHKEVSPITIEVDYVDLSTAMRYVIPLRTLIIE